MDERIEESQDPEKSIDRAMENYLKLGYSSAWINKGVYHIKDYEFTVGQDLFHKDFKK